MTTLDTLMQRVPEQARGALQRFLSETPSHGTPAMIALVEVMKIVAWPPHTAPIPLASELTPAQRAVAEVFAERAGIDAAAWAIPRARWNQRRWLGLEAGGVLERALDGRPMWRHFREAELQGEHALKALFTALPLAERLDAFAYLALSAYRFRQGAAWIPWGSVDEIDDKHGTWAAQMADFLLELLASGDGLMRGPGGLVVPDALKRVVFAALLRAGIAIEPRWDVLLPMGGSIEELVRAIPQARREKAILDGFAFLLDVYVVDKVLALLPHFPSAGLTRAALARARKVDTWPEKKLLEALSKLAVGHPEIEAEISAYCARLAAMPKLKALRVIRPAHASELSPIQREQVVRAGVLLDGQELTAEERMAESREEPAFRALEVWEIAQDRKLAYEVFLPDRDSGTVFRAGTTTVVAQRAQGGIECSDADLREALKAVLSAPPKPPRKKAPSPAGKKSAAPKKEPKRRKV